MEREVLDLEPVNGNNDKKGEYFHIPLIQTLTDIHIVYNRNRKTVKHVVLDPKKIINYSFNNKTL